MRITGLNHVTLAVRDLDQSIDFYCNVLGCSLRATWAGGAYLEAGALWLCLSHDPLAREAPHPDCTHLALDVAEADFDELSRRVRESARLWKDIQGKGPLLFFLDPDGHKLELHVGSLEARISQCQAQPPQGWKLA